MQLRSIAGLTILVLSLLCFTTTAFVVPNVYLPSSEPMVSTGTTESTVNWYSPRPPCYECMPAPTPAPVYQTIGLSVAVPITKVRMNSNVQFVGNQVSGTPVLSTATWDWIVQPPKGLGYQGKGMVVTFKAVSFGTWRINLNVRDTVQMLNGHYTGNVMITEKR